MTKCLFVPLSDGGGGTGCVELEVCPCGGPHTWLVPAMLSPPESLLMSCVRQGNFMEAHQVCVASCTVLCVSTKSYCFFLVTES